MLDFHYQELSNRLMGADDRATFSEIARWISVVALLVCFVLAYAWSRNEILTIHYQMEHLRKESNELREINAALRAEHSFPDLVNGSVYDNFSSAPGAYLVIAPDNFLHVYEATYFEEDVNVNFLLDPGEDDPANPAAGTGRLDTFRDPFHVFFRISDSGAVP